MAVHFDVGLIVFMANNYGSAATNIALYHAIEKLGYSTVVLDTLAKPTGISNHYVKNYLNASSAYSKGGNTKWANAVCDTFVVGSDQCWRWEFSRFQRYMEYYLLAFASEKRRKIAYASSFGPEQYDIGEDLQRLFSHLLKRFDSVSVREDYAVDICRELFGVRSKQVADPVFLLDKSDYDRIGAQATLDHDDDYLLAYILEPTPQKRKLIYDYASRTGLKPIVICDSREFKRKRALMDMPETLDKPNIAEWFSYLANASFVLTDSFHGTCFSLINEKPFLAIKRGARQRFDSLARIIESAGSDASCIRENVEDAFAEKPFNLNYQQTGSALAELRDSSLEWLSNALSGNSDASPQNTEPWLDYARLVKDKLSFMQNSDLQYANSIREALGGSMQEGKTFLQALYDHYGLGDAPRRDFQDIEELDTYFNKLGNLSQYTFFLSCKDDCGSFWNRFLEKTGLPLKRNVGNHVSYVAVAAGTEVLYEKSSREPIDKTLTLTIRDGKPALQDDAAARKTIVKKLAPFARSGNGGAPLVVHAYLHSMRTEKKAFTQKSMININCIDYSMDSLGLNVVVLENETGQVVDSFCIDLQGDKDTKIQRIR